LLEKCMKDLDNFDVSQAEFFLQGLFESIQEAANVNVENYVVRGNDGYRDTGMERSIDEIVCYGIGTFFKSSDNMHSMKRYNPPLIQLACALVLRNYFAIYRKQINVAMRSGDCDRHDNDKNLATNPQKLTYQEQQDIVPTYYFEPFIQPLERKVLNHFHVKVLDVNEQGKRRISVKGQVLPKSSTLFYMPHCPMRLYSNVLWANWNIEGEEDVLMDGRIVIMGNSFRAYDDRIISSEKKNDKTNAIFPLLPFTQEVKVLASKQGTGNKKKKTIYTGSVMTNDALSFQEVELSFNDSAIISFSKRDGSLLKVQEDLNLPFPKQPEEYFVGNDESGEVV